MTATNPRPWRDQITVDPETGGIRLDGRYPTSFACIEHLLDEAHALAAEVERLRGSDLPDGVQPWTADPLEIDGVPVVGVAMGDVVRGLPNDEWLRTRFTGYWYGGSNSEAVDDVLYLLGRKPHPTPPPTERVKWWEAFMEELPIAKWDGQKIKNAQRQSSGVFLATWGLFPVIVVDDDGTVEVLR